MSPKTNDTIDQLLLHVGAEVREAANSSFDLRAGLAAVKQDAAARQAVMRKTALVEEAERLVQVTVGWEDAAVRLVEIAELWHSGDEIDAASEKALWSRFIAARRAFRKQHKVTFAAAPHRRPQPAGDPTQQPKSVLTIAEAEQQLRDLLDTEPPDEHVWRIAATAMTEYCMSSVIGWLRAGHVPVACTLTSSQAERLVGPWTVDDLARVSSAVAAQVVRDFRNHRLPRGLWRQKQGVTLAEELLNGCAANLPRELWRVAAPQVSVTGVERSVVKPRTSDDAVQELRAAGYSRAETAELLRLPDEAAVSRAAARASRDHDEATPGEDRHV